MIASVFKHKENITNPTYSDIDSILEGIKNCVLQEEINQVRSEKDEKKRKELKGFLPNICFSGKFKTRADKHIIEHSGFAILDIDHIGNIDEVKQRKEEIKQLPYVYACFVSPSGDGLKVLVRIPADIKKHRGHYKALMKLFPQSDSSSINESRVCYSSADSDIYINKNAIEFTDYEEIKKIEPKTINHKPCKATDYFKINIAAKMIQQAADGDKTRVLIKASRLLGGYIVTGFVDEYDAIHALESEISKRDIDDFSVAQKAIKAGIEYGKDFPIFETEEFKQYKPNQYNPSQKKESEKEAKLVQTLLDSADDFIQYVFQEGTNTTTGMESFDLALKNRLRGKLGCIIGYGGSKKSLFALNAALKNIHLNNDVCIYSTMEMNTFQLIDRILDIVVDGGQTNFSEEITKIGREEAKKLLINDIIPLIGDKLYITQNSSLTVEDYDKILSYVYEKNGRVNMLIVDGLGMMGGSEKETERYSENSKKLKELANKWNILIFLICHVSKGADKHTRDLLDKIRGSEKIADNCDFIITMSQLIDKENSTQESFVYRSDKGYSRLYDKRGSGKTVSKIFDFVSTRLTINECNDNPYNYEIDISSLKKENEKTDNNNEFSI